MKIRVAAIAVAGSIALGLGARAETKETEVAEVDQGWNWAMGDGITYDEKSIVSTEVSAAFDSKYLSYGLVDNNDPIYTIGGEMTFFEWVTIGSSAIFDMSRYGIDAGYKNRGGKVIEYHPTANIGHSFSPEDFDWLPTTIEFSAGFDYEYRPRVCTEGQPRGGDTDFWTFEVGLPDLWIEPTFYYERDCMRDHGTYLNLELGHTFAIIDGDEEDDDPMLAVRPSIGQGWGDRKRVRGYLCDDQDGRINHSGLMDTTVKGELTWNICSGVSLSGYVAYVDFLFDPSLQDGATRYEATEHWTDSWNFVCGVNLAVAF